MMMNDQTAKGCRLPLELVQHILTYLSNDDEHEEWNKKSSSLLSVCLASHTMCQLAAPHLYRTVILNDPRRAQIFFSLFDSKQNPTKSSWNNSKSIVRLHMKYLWCGIMRELLYDFPHKLLHEVQTSAQEVAWMQADSDGRYHGFHYSTKPSSQSIKKHFCINAIHIVCPDLGRWTLPLFFHLESVKFVAVSLYPKGNWDLEAAKIEHVLRGILTSCRELEALEIIVCHTRAAAGSRAIRMNRSVPVAHAVRAIDDDRITVKAADYLFDVYGRSPADEVVQYTRIHWQDRVQGGRGPWAAMTK